MMELITRIAELLWANSALLMITLAPGYVYFHIQNKKASWVILLLTSLLFNTLLGCSLSLTGLFKVWFIIPVYFIILLYTLKYLRQDYIGGYLAFKKPLRWDLLFILSALFFVFIPHLRWIYVMEGVWPGDPIDRMGRVQLLVNGFNYMTDIIPGHFTWYPPVWTVLMGMAHFIMGMEISTVMSASGILWTIYGLILIKQIGDKIAEKGGGTLFLFISIGLLMKWYIDLPALSTPQGFSYLILLSVILILLWLNEDSKSVIFAGIGVGLSLLIYPHGGYITTVVYLVVLLLHLCMGKNSIQKISHITISLVLVGLISSLYWVPFFMKYGFSPPMGSWLRSVYKIETPIHSIRDVWTFMCMPYLVDLVFILILGWVLGKGKAKDKWFVWVVVGTYLSYYLLRWHHVISEPLLHFSVQPDRFERYNGIGQGVLFTTGLYYGVVLAYEKLKPLRRFPQSVYWYGMIITIGLSLILIPGTNRYVHFAKQILFPPPYSGDPEPKTRAEDDSDGYVMELSVLSMSSHPKFNDNEMTLARWIRTNTTQKSVFLSGPWESWYYLAGLSGRQVYVNMIPFHGPMDDSQPARLSKAEQLMTTTSRDTAWELLKEMKIDYIVRINPDWMGKPYGMIFDSDLVQEVYRQDGNQIIYSVKKNSPRVPAPFFPLSDPVK